MLNYVLNSASLLNLFNSNQSCISAIIKNIYFINDIDTVSLTTWVSYSDTSVQRSLKDRCLSRFYKNIKTKMV